MGQDAYGQDEVSLGVKVGVDLEVEEAGEEEGAVEVVDEFSDLVGADGDEALVVAVLAIFLLELDAPKSGKWLRSLTCSLR